MKCLFSEALFVMSLMAMQVVVVFLFYTNKTVY